MVRISVECRKLERIEPELWDAVQGLYEIAQDIFGAAARAIDAYELTCEIREIYAKRFGVPIRLVPSMNAFYDPYRNEIYVEPKISPKFVVETLIMVLSSALFYITDLNTRINVVNALRKLYAKIASDPYKYVDDRLKASELRSIAIAMLGEDPGDLFTKAVTYTVVYGQPVPEWAKLSDEDKATIAPLYTLLDKYGVKYGVNIDEYVEKYGDILQKAIELLSK